MADPTEPGLTLYIVKGKKKTFGVSFENKGPVKAGEVLTIPGFTIQSGSGVVVDGTLPAEILTADFVDGGGGKTVKAGKGLRVRLDATSGVVGSYTILASAHASGGDDVTVSGLLIVAAPPT